MQILIPISGTSDFFPKDEYYFPKPLIDVAGKPMIEIVISKLIEQFGDSKFVFVIDPNDSTSFPLDRTLAILSGNQTVVVEKPGPTSGALCSCLLAIDVIDHSSPLIIANSDQIIDGEISHLFNTDQNHAPDAAVLTFNSIHPRWSYVLEDTSGKVAQSYEKQVVSSNAIAGIYYFSQAKTFFNAAQRVILNNANVGNQYYISSTLNEIILDDGTVFHYPIHSDAFHSFYSPAKILEYERYLASNAIQAAPSSAIARPLNILIPAAGKGTRFSSAGWKKPKPFIDIMGTPMIHHVVNNLSMAHSSTTVQLRREHIDAYQDIIYSLTDKVSIFPIEQTTEGTASTLLLARQLFCNSNPLLVGNSDQIVDFSVDLFIGDCLSRGLDGSILVFRDKTRNPKWSFVELDDKGLVSRVAEKKPISDIATVGIYYFSKGCDFAESAIDMILANDRTNNEYYTCPVYNYMIQKGARIGVYEVPQEAMCGLGTPEDLNKFLHEKGAPLSLDSP